MTLEEAVAVLNRERHREYGGWKVAPLNAYCSHPLMVAIGPDERMSEIYLLKFEAIAIAETYERERQERPQE